MKKNDRESVQDRMRRTEAKYREGYIGKQRQKKIWEREIRER